MIFNLELQKLVQRIQRRIVICRDDQSLLSPALFASEELEDVVYTRLKLLIASSTE